jgi:hypothetical protein
MPMCTWCGQVSPAVKVLQDGGTVVRICARCADRPNFQLSHEAVGVDPDEEERPRFPGWIRATALLVLVALLIPSLMLLVSLR